MIYFKNKTLKKNLLVFCLFLMLFSCKKENGNIEDNSIQVGQAFGGGIVFYIDGSGEHGLVAASEDLQGSVKWSDSLWKTSAVHPEIGKGIENTSAIVNVNGNGSYAASLCDQLVLQGYSDWFLPSKNELGLLYQQRNEIGGFMEDFYWSSSEYDSLNAWYLYFPYGPQYFTKKDSTARVRAIRAF